MTTRANISYPQEGGILFTTIEGKSDNGYISLREFEPINAGDVILVTFDYRSDFIFAIGDPIGNAYRIQLNATSHKARYAKILKFAQPISKWSIQLLTYWSGGQTLWVNNMKLFNLTQMFGAGNEPTTIEEFYQRMPVGVDIKTYNKGELIDGHYSALKSTAFNQFNGTYAKVLAGVTYHVTGDITSIGFATEEGGTTEDITLDNGKYTPTQNGYIYASGENICIHLCWSEYAHMEDMYEAYKPYVRDLSWIKKYFPNGMRSAIDVRDEIRYNATEERWEAVQRVGVRTYASGDESNSAVTTDGKNTNYALATPIVTPIAEDVNLDYDCSDYGTEELISEGASAPLVADVVYAPNALSTLKQVPGILRDLNNVNIYKQDTLSLTVKDNGNIVIGNIAGQTKEFMPATPSGDPMHDTYVAAGATWSSTTGFWSLNGLKDITNEQMRKIYNVGFINDLSHAPLSGSCAAIRTNLLRVGIDNYPAGDDLFYLAHNNKTIEVLMLKNTTGTYESEISSSRFLDSFRGCTNIREIYGVLTTGGSWSGAFTGCASLRRVRIRSLKTNIAFSDSPLLDKESLLYMIEKARPTSAITITLHAEVYARLANDVDILAALSAQPNITLISA